MRKDKMLRSNIVGQMGQYDQLPNMASELVSRRVGVIAAAGGNVTAWPQTRSRHRHRSHLL
jgi:hypothetical protein